VGPSTLDYVITNSGSCRSPLSVTDDINIFYKCMKIITMHMKLSALVNNHKYVDDTIFVSKKMPFSGAFKCCTATHKKEVLHERFLL
jgi:hypothetical protein